MNQLSIHVFKKILVLIVFSIVLSGCNSGEGVSGSNAGSIIISPSEDPVVDPTPDPVVDPTPDPVVDPTPDPVVDPTPDPVVPPSEITASCDGFTGTTVDLAWGLPVTYTTGDPLAYSTLAQYRVYYGTESRSYPSFVAVDDPSLLSCAFSGIETGTYYFSVTVVLNDGTESDYSNELSITL
jgi:hypothetical protein